MFNKCEFFISSFTLRDIFLQCQLIFRSEEIIDQSQNYITWKHLNSLMLLTIIIIVIIILVIILLVIIIIIKVYKPTMRNIDAF